MSSSLGESITSSPRAAAQRFHFHDEVGRASEQSPTGSSPSLARSAWERRVTVYRADEDTAQRTIGPDNRVVSAIFVVT